jgi:glycosyltransferase involved in cell wall biosynthesis
MAISNLPAEVPAHERDKPTPAPVISVVIPGYNCARSLPATLDSVLAQTFRDYEIIVVNDGSPDTPALEKALAPYRDKIRYFTQENQGPAGARNHGIRVARGEFIALLDADDLWDPEHLAKQLKVLQADPSADMVYADARIFGDVPERGRTVMEFCPSDGDVTFESLVTRRCTVHICVSLVRKQALIDTGLFDTTFRGTEDLDMWLRMAQQGRRIAYQKRVLGSYRRQPGSLSADPGRLIEGLVAVLQKAAKEPGVTDADRKLIERDCQQHLIRLAFEKGRKAFIEGDKETAIRDLAFANEHYKSFKLSVVLLLLRFSPGLLRSFYHWRERRSRA